MKRFIEGEDRSQSTLFPERLDDYIGEDNPARIVDGFVDALDLARLGFEGASPDATGRPAYHPATLLKLYADSADVGPRIRVMSGVLPRLHGRLVKS